MIHTRSHIQEAPGRRKRHPASHRRSGTIVLEFIITFPVLFLATLAIFQFGILVLVQQFVTTAVIEGAREGAKLGLGTDTADVADAVAEVIQKHLTVVDIEFTTPDGQNADDQVRVVVETDREAPTNVIEREDRGNQSIPCTRTGDDPENDVAGTGHGEIVVTLCVQISDPAPGTNCKPVPNWLTAVGIDFAGREFEITSRALLENNEINP